MWPKIIDLIIAWLKSRPRTELTQQILELRDAMRHCHHAYVQFSEAKETRDQAAIDMRYQEWRGAFGVLDTAVANVDEVLHIFGKDAREQVNSYLISEQEPCPEDGRAVSAGIVELLNEMPENPRATTGTVEFEDALTTLDEFIRNTFKPEEVVAAKRPLL